MAASKQASIHTQVRNAVTLVWGSLRLAPTVNCVFNIVKLVEIRVLARLLQMIYNTILLGNCKQPKSVVSSEVAG